MPSKSHSRFGIFRRFNQSFKAKWKLADKVDELKHRLKLRDERIEDLEEMFQAFKEVNDALRNEHRLLGMLAEADLQKIVQPREGESRQSATSLAWTGGEVQERLRLYQR